MKNTAEAALRQRKDLKTYGTQARLLFALETALGLDDIHTIAADSLTDGPDDKKCDLLFVDSDSGRVILAQHYHSFKSKTEAPATKASDLNTAAGWLLAGNPESLPAGLQSAGHQLHQALTDGLVGALDIWYCHNLPESENVRRELAIVQSTAESHLRRNYPNASVAVHALEVGLSTLEEWYHGTRIPIVIGDEFDVPVGSVLNASGDSWAAATASVPLSWLHGLYQSHGRKLFSANVRDYLGSVRSDRNINHQIKETARTSPRRFWPYNNGITALVHDFSFDSTTGVLHLKGIAIVNGAQTTGAIGQLTADELAGAAVLARFVKTTDRKVVENIITFNNTQNKIDPADFHSNDPVQDRLRSEFEKLPGVLYLGFRRGGEDDKIRRPQNLVPSQTAGQALVAFHQDPNLAYNKKSQIWESDATYGRYYSDHLRARHLLFAFALLRAVESVKATLSAKPDAERTKTDLAQLEFFGQRGSTFLLTSAVASCLEAFLGHAVPDVFNLGFSGTTKPEDAQAHWRPVVEITLPFVTQLLPAATAGLKNDSQIRACIDTFRSLVESTKAANASTFRALARRIEKMSVPKVLQTRLKGV